MTDWVDWKGLKDDRRDKKWDSFSWVTFRALISSLNHVINLGAPRLVPELRQGWIAREPPSGGKWDAGDWAAVIYVVVGVLVLVLPLIFILLWSGFGSFR